MNKVLPPTRDHRLRHALGLLADLESLTYKVSGRETSLLVRAGMDRESFEATLAQYPSGTWFLRYAPHARRSLYTNYVEPITRLAAELGHDKAFLLFVGDNIRSLPAPSFVRARPIGHPGLGVLSRFLSVQHTPHTRPLTDGDKPFEAKEDRLLWRGATTGRFTSRPGTAGFSSRFHVMNVAQKAREADPRIDIGYSSIVQRETMGKGLAKRAERLGTRPRIEWGEMLNARYVLCLEGNDVATALPWVLHANTCPVMPTPLFESWRCEAALVPFVHYAPVAPSLRDIVSVFHQRVSQTQESATIAANGRAFIEAFDDEAAEHALALDVAREMFHRVRLVADRNATLPDGLL